MGTEKSAGIVLFRNDSDKNEFLLLNYPQGHWDFVKGKIEQNETSHEAAIRETREETGLRFTEIAQLRRDDSAPIWPGFAAARLNRS